MAIRKNHNHTIDFVFPLAVLFVFAVSAFTVLLLSAHVYADQTARSQSDYQASTPLSYIREKVRQNDQNGTLSAGTIDGQNCLILQSEGNTTYIYSYKGTLKELYIRNGVEAHAKDGKDILEIKHFQIQELSDGLFRISCQTSDGAEQSVILSERSAS